MAELVDPTKIEAIVGTKRHWALHMGRWVTSENMVYILHSARCIEVYADLRTCPFSRALDAGCDPDEWDDWRDQPVALGMATGTLAPYPLPESEPPAVLAGLITDELVERCARAGHKALGDSFPPEQYTRPWDEVDEAHRAVYRLQVRAVLAEALCPGVSS